MRFLRHSLITSLLLLISISAATAQVAPGERNIYLEFDTVPSTITFSEGWSNPRIRQDGVSYRFMTAAEANITVPLAPGNYYMVLHLSSVGSAALRESLSLTVNDQPVELEVNESLDLTTTISETLVDDMWPVRIAFSVNPDTLASLQTEQNAMVGLAFDRLILVPQEERSLSFPLVTSRVELQFDDFTEASGFGPPRRTRDNITYRYMIEPKAALNLRVPGNDSILRVKFSSVGSADLLASLQLLIDGEVIALNRIGDRTFEANIPGRLLSDTGTALTFSVDPDILSTVQAEANNTPIGIGFDWLRLQPLSERDVLMPRAQMRLVMDFDEELPMLGFDVPRRRQDGVTYRFMSSPTAVIRANLSPADYILELSVASVGSGDLARSLQLDVNGEPVELTFETSQGYRATIPASLITPNALTMFTFTVDQSALNAVQAAGTAATGIAFDQLTLTAATNQ